METMVRGLNRTFMELKSAFLAFEGICLAGLNRTFMELKYVSNHHRCLVWRSQSYLYGIEIYATPAINSSGIRLNRTFMELKFISV